MATELEFKRLIECSNSMEALEDSVRKILGSHTLSDHRPLIFQALVKARDIGIKKGIEDAHRKIRNILGIERRNGYEF